MPMFMHTYMRKSEVEVPTGVLVRISNRQKKKKKWISCRQIQIMQGGWVPGEDSALALRI